MISIDHVELFVPDRYDAAAWYEKFLGLSIIPEYEHWAKDPGGPLMISGDSGSTKIALFEGNPAEYGAAGGFYQLAVRMPAPKFRAFVALAGEMNFRDRLGNPSQPVDHGQAFSIYFLDPWGHCLEVTCYDHEEVRATR